MVLRPRCNRLKVKSQWIVTKYEICAILHNFCDCNKSIPTTDICRKVIFSSTNFRAYDIFHIRETNVRQKIAQLIILINSCFLSQVDACKTVMEGS